MTRIVCAGCNRTFSDLPHFSQHLESDGNYGCWTRYFRRKGPNTEGTKNRKKSVSGNKRKKTIEEIEEVLKQSEEAKRKRSGQKKLDMTVFDFHSGDTDDDSHHSTPTEGDTIGNNGPPVFDKADDDENKGNNTLKRVREAVKEGAGRSSGLGGFRNYVDDSRQNFAELEPHMKAAIELMSLMNLKGGSLGLYEAVMEWHIRHLEGKQEKVSADKLHNTLIKRYNLENTLPYEVPTDLPSANTQVPLVCHDCEAMTVDLLTDPSASKDDFLFPNNHPAGKPPEEFNFVSDIISGHAYRETYEALIAPMPTTECGRVRMLCPYILYLDGCVTGQFQNQEIEILKFTLGLFTRKARRQSWCWRNLGFVHKLVKGHDKGKKMLASSQHVDTLNYVAQEGYRADRYCQLVGNVPDFDVTAYDRGRGRQNRKASVPTQHAQDLHKMLQVILSSYKDIELAGGMDWDFVWGDERIKARLVPFVIVAKLDGKEADKVCGQYTTKLEDVKCLCRVCTCPTQHSHEAYRDDPLKTQPMIHDLVRNGDKSGLRNMSQQFIWNAFHELTFGQHNDRGIHGATPPDLTHWMQIGQFKYTRECFFAQTGESTKLTESLEATASYIGILLQRQSDRNLPRTTFNRGIQGGKLMAHEMSGVILVLNATLRSTEGRELILNTARGDAKKHFPNEAAVARWIMLLEAQLQMEAWLREPEHDVESIKRADTKFREYMNMCKRVQKREVGMKHNTLNHHVTKHIPQSMLDFGSADNVDTFDQERHHKDDKKTAQRTQKHADKFDIQMGKKIVQRKSVSLGMLELQGRKRWLCYTTNGGFDDTETDPPEPFDPVLVGVKCTVSRDNDGVTWKVHSKMRGKDHYTHDESTRTAIEEILDFCDDYIDEIVVYDEYKVWNPDRDNNTQIYRASPHYDSKPWYDWAMFDLSKDENTQIRNYVPCQIKCFLDLTSLPPPAEEHLGILPGAYAVVEPTVPNPDKTEIYRSELWEPWLKQPSRVECVDARSNFAQLVNLNLLLGPTAVIPDTGNKNPRAYLRLSPRCSWAILFQEWLNAPHTRAHDDQNKDNSCASSSSSSPKN